MGKKTCFKCGEKKPVSEFYAHKGMKDGRLNKCKECTKADNRSNQRKKKKYYRRYDKERQKRPERKLQQTESCLRIRAKYPEKYKARTAVSNALRDGRLRKGPCALCGSKKRVQGHHPDYSKPLEVTWLCEPCHKRHHGDDWDE